MDTIRFLVQGSSTEPYKVTFQKHGTNLSAFCTCPAGDNGQYCKHRFSILNGFNDGIVSDNKADVQIVASWLPGTDVDAAMNAVIDAEETYELAKRNLSDTKKRLAKAFRD
jgi:hypothetical protein